MKHYTKEELELYRNGKMSVLGKIVCGSHLHDCAACSRLMEELKEDDKLIANLRSSIQQYQEVSHE
jgi:hypothetical protein